MDADFSEWRSYFQLLVAVCGVAAVHWLWRALRSDASPAARLDVRSAHWRSRVHAWLVALGAMGLIYGAFQWVLSSLPKEIRHHLWMVPSMASLFGLWIVHSINDTLKLRYRLCRLDDVLRWHVEHLRTRTVPNSQRLQEHQYVIDHAQIDSSFSAEEDAWLARHCLELDKALAGLEGLRAVEGQHQED